MAEKGFSTYEVAEILRVSRSTIQQIIDRGIYTASIEEAGGKGTRNVFSRKDILCVYLIIVMSKIGMRQKDAAAFVKTIDFDNHNRIGPILPFGGAVSIHIEISILEKLINENIEKLRSR